VVIVALQNDDLDATYEELCEALPQVEFRKVGQLPQINRAAAGVADGCGSCNCLGGGGMQQLP
jgi:hypothetical protein